MKTCTELKDILEKHSKWLRHEEGGERANLSDADLSNADLYKADLSNANLSRADLSNANLSFANLSNADLFKAHLSSADLSNAGLSNADLFNANLFNANLSKADLSEANLFRVGLSGANITNSILNKVYPICCPESGSFIGWKKCLEDKIVKLEILEEAKRLSSTGRKCRCSAAKVLAIEDVYGNFHTHDYASSHYDSDFIYKVGEIVSVDDFDDDRREECSRGIHFFITRQEAVDYRL